MAAPSTAVSAWPVRVVKWLLLSAAVGALAGTASAVFLYALDWATATREAHRWLVAWLPMAGFAVAWVYLQVGQRVEAGSQLLVDEIHDPRDGLPLRMAPLILTSTVVSHLFGASVGREGTAMQMGAALAEQFARAFKVPREDRRLLLMAGVSAGFASVFGTPLAATVFALEVLRRPWAGRLRSRALAACAVAATAAVVGHHIALLWGVEHVPHAASSMPPATVAGLSAVLLAGALFGLAGLVFISATHRLQAWARQHIAYSPLRPLIGGAVIAAAVFALDGWRYTGLGLPLIADAFTQALPPWEFAAKLLASVAALGSGFKGGEVTPLFAIGAALGNALAPLLHQPVALLAGLGFVSVFAGAAHTPLAGAVMAMELFGADIGLYALLACGASHLCAGRQGLYRAPRTAHRKPRRG